MTEVELCRRIRASAIESQWRSVLRRDPCVYCGDPADTCDHIVPRAHGGLSNVDNLAPACQPCNGRKSDQPLLVFLAYGRKARWTRRAELRAQQARMRAEVLARVAHSGPINRPRWKD